MAKSAPLAPVKKGWQLGKRIAPPRYLLFLGVLALASPLLATLTPLTREQGMMVGFDLATLAFLGSLWPLFKSDPGDIAGHADANDANRFLLLIVTGVVMIVILVTVAVELAGDPEPSAIALVVVTLGLAWLFSNTVYALHYAHLFYGDPDADGKHNGGLDVPECDEPDYWDFVYFAYTLGMTFQTSDVAMTSSKFRKIATLHCLAAFVFNLGVLAFTINVLGG